MCSDAPHQQPIRHTGHKGWWENIFHPGDMITESFHTPLILCTSFFVCACACVCLSAPAWSILERLCFSQISIRRGRRLPWQRKANTQTDNDGKYRHNAVVRMWNEEHACLRWNTSEHIVPAVASPTETSTNKTNQRPAAIMTSSVAHVHGRLFAFKFACICWTLALMLLCPRAHVFMKHLCRSVSVKWCVTIHPYASQPLADWRLIINANYNHRSRSELERIIAPLWLCVRGWVCVDECVYLV